ncbi:cytochrome P450 monooxygenase 26 [Heterobasidion irregulare TC 32-1]|uniref:Cytochrome P450 monooxygenase 26 n=1 Tax=Heterobasidion irregulare (strain TC 32-1) TaxID=747525 RepID=W4JUT2_HETIT|nr:cytochrome P450 monooxygenase 26 [Heterobasidion irregulare TC 32-1]ETW77249.1 cytochrome P450 monooxygenase 26 [Heterobasidion irregulare TC 32-1]
MFASLFNCIILLIVPILLKIYYKRRRNHPDLPCPPGPKPLPLIGNILDIPKRAPWEVYAEWANQYGDIMSIQVLGQTVVIINSVQIARNLLEKRGSNYSDRPVVHTFEVMKFDFNLILARYASSRWKIGRKLVDHSLRQGASATYRPMQIRKVHKFLRKISHTNDIQDDIKHLSADIVMSLTYGYDIAESNDKFVTQVENIVQRAATALLPGTTMMNLLPFLKNFPAWLPGMSFKRDALNHIGEMIHCVEAPFSFTKGEIIKGTAQRSIVLDTMNSSSDKDLTGEEECILKEVAASLYIAGTDTTASLLAFFILALLRYPEVQERAQSELDAIVGRDRLPEYEDKEALPYINAICQELLRWRMVAPLGVPHAVMEDDVYEGLFIPKGSQILVNTWSMLHDPEVYPDPENFRPERFLASDGTLVDDPLLISIYGWGRRICPGRFLANVSIWLAVASTLSAFNVEKARDADGREIPVEDMYVNQGVVCQPLPFKCSITPRDAQAEKLVAATEIEMD